MGTTERTASRNSLSFVNPDSGSLHQTVLVTPGGQICGDGDQAIKRHVNGSVGCGSMCSGELDSVIRVKGEGRLRLSEPVRFNGFDGLDLNAVPSSGEDRCPEVATTEIVDDGSVYDGSVSCREMVARLPASSRDFDLNVARVDRTCTDKWHGSW